MDLRKAQRDLMTFVSMLRIDVAGRLVTLGEVLDDFQREFFESIDPALQRLVGRDVPCQFQRFWNEWPKGHSKSTNLAIVILWLLLASRRKVSGVGAAGDKDQARLLRDAIDDLVRWNPILAQVVDIQAFRILNKHTGSEFEIISSDGLTSHGQRRDLIVCDELVHWLNVELWHSLLSTAAKNPRCVLAVITNAGWRDSEWWAVREKIRSDPRWKFSRLEGPCASWLSADDLAEQERLLPRIVFERLWLNRWTETDGQSALEFSDIENAKTLPCAPNIRQRGKLYFAGVDIGVRRDFSAVVVVSKSVGWTETIRKRGPSFDSSTRAMLDLGLLDSPAEPAEYRNHPGDGSLELVSVRVWKPNAGRVELEEIENEVLLLDRQFGLSRVGADPYQAEYLMQRLSARGIAIGSVDFTSSNLQEMANALLDSFRERRIAIYPNEQLEADLRALRIVENTRGFRLTAPRTTDGGHADSAVALSLALMLAKQFCSRTFPVQRQLVYN